MSAFTRVDRTLPSGRPITILTPGRRRGGGDEHPALLRGVGARRGGDPPGRRGVGPRGRSHVHPAIDEIAVQARSPEVSMHDR